MCWARSTSGLQNVPFTLQYTVLATKVFRRRCFDLSPQEGSTEPGKFERLSGHILTFGANSWEDARHDRGPELQELRDQKVDRATTNKSAQGEHTSAKSWMIL